MSEPAKLIRINNIKLYTGAHPKIIELSERIDEPAIHGDKIWNASFVLMDFFNKFPLAQEVRVLDVGCGWGALSCYLAKKFDAKVTGMDADQTMKHYFDFHAQQNQLQMTFLKSTINAMTSTKLAQFDVIVGGDICFWDDLKLQWQGLIDRALRAGVSQIYLADPGRQPFWDLVDYTKAIHKADVWSHTIKKPISTEQYILEIDRS